MQGLVGIAGLVEREIFSPKIERIPCALQRHNMTEPCNWTVTANGIIIEDWTPFGLPLSSSASSLASLDSTSSACSTKKEMKDKETQTCDGGASACFTNIPPSHKDGANLTVSHGED